MQKTSTSEPPESLPTINLDAARTFVAICETGNFRRAADRVHLSPSAVSLQIGKLEAQLGCTLLDRNAQRVNVTEQGEVLLGFARRLLSINNETIAALRTSTLSGRLRVAAPHDLGASIVPDILRRAASLHPHVSVEVRLDTGANVERLFVEGDVNLAIFNESGDSRIKATRLSSEPLVWTMQKGGTAIDVEPLPLALASVGCAWRDAALTALDGVGKDYRIAYLSDSSAGQVAAVRADLAVAALPLSWSARNLVEVPSEYGLPPLGQTHVCLAHDGSEIAMSLAALAAT